MAKGEFEMTVAEFYKASTKEKYEIADEAITKVDDDMPLTKFRQVKTGLPGYIIVAIKSGDEHKDLAFTFESPDYGNNFRVEGMTDVGSSTCSVDGNANVYDVIVKYIKDFMIKWESE